MSDIIHTAKIFTALVTVYPFLVYYQFVFMTETTVDVTIVVKQVSLVLSYLAVEPLEFRQCGLTSYYETTIRDRPSLFVWTYSALYLKDRGISSFKRFLGVPWRIGEEPTVAFKVLILFIFLLETWIIERIFLDQFKVNFLWDSNLFIDVLTVSFFQSTYLSCFSSHINYL